MTSDDFVAKAEIAIDSSPDDVWEALVDPDRIEQYMFGTRVATDWGVGSPITWTGEWEGTAYEDKGQILEYRPRQRLRYSHYSPLSGAPDLPENYHTVTIALAADGDATNVTLIQDNNPTEEARSHSQDNWQSMLDALKKHVETYE